MTTFDPEPSHDDRSPRAATMTRIARLAGVSVATVSKVINGRPGVSTRTRQRIEEIIRQQGYRRTTHPESVPIVEIVFQALDSPWALEIIRGVENTVRPHGLAVAVTEMEGNLTPPPHWAGELLARRPVGVIGVSARLTEAQHAQLASRAVPLVALDPTGEPRHRTPSAAGTGTGRAGTTLVVRESTAPPTG